MRMTLMVWITVMLPGLILGCGSQARDKDPKVSTEIAMPFDVRYSYGFPVIAVYVQEDWLYLPDCPRWKGLIVAIWKNGRIVWGADPADGGPPYYVGTIRPDQVRAVLETISQMGLFDDPDIERHRINYGPDAPFIAIAIDDGTRCQQLSSWHELFERNSTLVATEQGIESLNGRNRDEVLAGCSAGYRKFREVWEQIRKLLRDIIPIDGEVLEDFVFFLQPNP